MYAYDPGFRLQGEGQHIILKEIQGFDHRVMLINFALTGNMYDSDFSVVNDFMLSGKFAINIWILLNKGTIKTIVNLDLLQNHTNIVHFIQRFYEGDQVTAEMVGTERQVFARIYVVGDSRLEIKEVSKFIHEHLEIYDQHGDSMIVDRFYPE